MPIRGGGERELARLFLEPAEPEEIRRRQEGIRELAGKLEWRREFEAQGLAVPPKGKDPGRMLTWLESAPLDLAQKGWVKAALFLPALLFAGFALNRIAGWPVFLWTVPLGLQILLVFFLSRRFQIVYETFAPFAEAIPVYGRMLARIEEEEFSSEALREIRSDCLQESGGASVEVRRLERIVQALDVRHGHLLHPVLNLLLLYDLFFVRRLEFWQKRNGSHLRRWFRAVARMEGFSSLAALHHENPGFAFPDVAGEGAAFEAKKLGHPLIDPEKRVENDTVLPEGGVLLITGSNMSGKSTLLRSVGINAVLAYAGGPVCADSLRISRMELRTCIAPRDSLEEGISSFYAELRRIHRVVETARGDRKVLFLLDEIFHGTNARERRIGAEGVIEFLVESGSTGAVTTHDLALAELQQKLPGRVRNVHFMETVEDGKMTFDYLLRDGPVRSSNALRLMRQLGIPVPEPTN